MAITDRSRKLLWGRSGNRCAFCGIELVAEKDENNVNLNLGEECHIVSSKPTGPRHNTLLGDFDDYENLILLCRNHHRTIDEREETFTVDLLKNLKANHEKWVKSIIDKAQEKEEKPNHKIYQKINSGKDILNIIHSVHASHFDHDDLKTKEEVEEISSFFQNLKDWIDVLGMGMIEKADEVKLGFDLNDEISRIEKLGFYLFGGADKVRVSNNKKEDMGVFEIATILALRKDNPAIINSEMVAATRPVGTRFAF